MSTVVIAWDEVDAAEGTGIVHIAPGAEKRTLPSPRNTISASSRLSTSSASTARGSDWLTGQYVHEVAVTIAENLEQKGLLYRAEQYRHRYPVCWRCGTDLVFRLVDEWFIAMDDLRQPMMDVTHQMTWHPSFGLDRELDWLAHMDDWMISKKRYWGLALPIYECTACGNFDVIGSETELRDRAVEGWDEFAGHTPPPPMDRRGQDRLLPMWRNRLAHQGRRESLARRRNRPFSTLRYRDDPRTGRNGSRRR